MMQCGLVYGYGSKEKDMGLETVGTPLAWIGFTAIVLIMLVLDLGVFHRKAHTVSLREAAI